MGLGASNPRLDSTYGHVVDVPRAEGGGPVYRHKLGYAELVDRLESPDGYTAFTLYDVFQHGLQVNPSGPCLGTRALARNGAPGPYLWTSYQACWGRAQRFGAGLHALGLVPPRFLSGTGPSGLRPLGIYARNRQEWVLAEQVTHPTSQETVDPPPPPPEGRG